MGTFVSKFRAQRHTAFKCSGWRFLTADSSCESPETHQHAIWEVCWVPYLARRYDNNGTTNRAHRNFHTSMCGATLGFKRKGNTRRDVAVSKLCEVELKCHKESSGNTRRVELDIYIPDYSGTCWCGVLSVISAGLRTITKPGWPFSFKMFSPCMEGGNI